MSTRPSNEPSGATLRLNEICAAIVDCEHKTAPEGDGYALSVGTRAMKDGRLVIDACKRVSEQTYVDWSRRMVPVEGDLVLAREAPVGQVVRVPRLPRICLGQRTVLIRPDADRVYPRFLHYWLLGPDAQGPMTAQAGGATVAHLNVEDIRRLDVSKLPQARKHQRAAALALGAIDDLIENNRRRVAVLEEIARTIYREWFAHFRYPGHDTATFVDSPLGPIPQGWLVVPLFEAAEVGFGFSFKAARFADAGPYPVIRIRDVPHAVTETFSDERPAERYRVRDGDVLIGMDGDFHLGLWRGNASWLNQRVTRLRPANGMSSLHLMFAVADQIRRWNNAITGTTVAHLGKRHLEKVMVVVPGDSILAPATEFFENAAHVACALDQSRRQLARIRDLLLPKLVTGQIDVSSLDLDGLVEAAVG